VRRPQYQKYSEEKNKDRLLNPGDAFSELCMDFEFQIAALAEVRPAPAAPLRHRCATPPHGAPCVVQRYTAGVAGPGRASRPARYRPSRVALCAVGTLPLLWA
jgi:hypothetical protein